MRLAFASSTASVVIDAARHWRIARDLGQPVQPALSTRLGVVGGGLLAPVFDGLLTVFEAAFRRRFEAGDPSDGDLTGDEEWLIELLDHDDTNPPAGIRPDLVGALRTAFRSTRIMLGSVLSPLTGEVRLAEASRNDEFGAVSGTHFIAADEIGSIRLGRHGSLGAVTILDSFGFAVQDFGVGAFVIARAGYLAEARGVLRQTE